MDGSQCQVILLDCNCIAAIASVLYKCLPIIFAWVADLIIISDTCTCMNFKFIVQVVLNIGLFEMKLFRILAQPPSRIVDFYFSDSGEPGFMPPPTWRFCDPSLIIEGFGGVHLKFI